MEQKKILIQQFDFIILMQTWNDSTDFQLLAKKKLNVLQSSTNRKFISKAKEQKENG